MEDFDLNAKHAIEQFGWSIETFDNADYYRYNEIMKAKEHKERPADPLAAIAGIRMAQTKRKGGVKRG
ncbi:hypothetical protein EFO75_07510 [Limosilactobacillus reuteri]|nr:hypothetical protein [Limosilactobacillus reuteri]MCT3197311.1 hypothetical protein [Limosilactobacillus reuteri]MCT3208503.1 hypothetical protein [Limosilactobacillus reuteri]MCT3216270.1 hypothetical protein [Limosilactobacillus reuteri]NDO57209.1 hypothetical protein [Limosilactobacillus reuteri]